MSETLVQKVIALYMPLIVGAIFILSVPLLYFLEVDKITLYYFLTLTIIMYLVLALHRIHEYKYGFSIEKADSKIIQIFFNSVLYATGFMLFPISLRLDSVIFALIGSFTLIAAVLRGKNTDTNENEEESSPPQEGEADES